MNMFAKMFKRVGSREKTIFILGDNDLYAKSLEKFLITRLPEFNNIKIFSNGESCLLELKQNPTVIIMDDLIKKNISSAPTALSTIKNIKSVSSKTNVILLSSQKEFDVVGKSIAKFGCIYLQKDEHSFYKVEALIKSIFNREN